MYRYSIVHAIAAELPSPLINALRRNPKVSYVELDKKVQLLADDVLPWGIDRVDAEVVWGGSEDSTNIMVGSVTGSDVNVAVLDTGIDYTHPDLNDNYAGGYDFVNNDDDPKDDHYHGTHCCGIIGAEENTEGVIGIAPEVNLYAVKVLDSGGSGYSSDIVAGIDWAVTNDMDVISMSFGSSVSDSTIKAACDAAYGSGVVLVSSSGNSGDGSASTTEWGYPAAYSSVIAVGATDSNDDIAGFSNSGPYLELAAPGVNILSTTPTYGGSSGPPWERYTQGYDTFSGTSMACPHVAGAAAMVISTGPIDIDGQCGIANEVRNILNSTAEDINLHVNFAGNGLLDVEAAVDAAAFVDQGIIYNPREAYYPSVVYTGEQYLMLYDKNAEYATSNDGVNWSYGGSTTGLTNPWHMVMLYDANGFGGGDYTYKIWYFNYDTDVPNGVDAIRYAESTNGIEWVNDQAVFGGNMVVYGRDHVEAPARTWGPGYVRYTPDAPNTGDNPMDYSYVMYYNGYNGITDDAVWDNT
ncbi:MAG: S8 family serine peptidase, partial [Thermoplasmatota archaeon]